MGIGHSGRLKQLVAIQKESEFKRTKGLILDLGIIG